MSGVFGPLLRVGLRHEYYGNTPPPLRLTPTSATQRLIAQANGVARAQADGFQIFVPEDREDLKDLATDGHLTFVFRLHATDPAINVATSVLNEVRELAFEITADMSDVLSGKSTPPASALRRYSGPEDMPGKPPLSPFAEPADAMKPPLAFVQISLAPDTADAQRMIRLDTTAAHWIYHLVGAETDTGYSVKDSDATVQFSEIEPRVLANGATARRLRSDTAMPVLARPNKTFQLMAEGAFGPRVVVPVLPAAAPTLMTPDPSGAGLSTDIFVNLT